MNPTSIPAPITTQDLDRYVALGRTKLALRDELARLEAEREAQERRAAILEQWRDTLEKVHSNLPPGFDAYIVEPTEPLLSGRYEPRAYRPLVLDLTPLGLGPLGAYLDCAKEGGIGWAAPRAGEDEDTGRKALYPPPALSQYEMWHLTSTFTEALALAQDVADEVARHNARLAAPEPDLYAPLAGKGGGCYPVLHVGDNRAEAYAFGAADAQKFGALYGADDWLANMAVHTFSFPGAPVEGGVLYAFLALVPVAPDKWRDLVGRLAHAD